MVFFEIEGISKKTLSIIFLVKIVFGLLLWAIYTFYYTNRATADIYKYFDDSKVIFDTLKTNPVHFFKLLFGIANNTPEFDTYYTTMNFWARKLDSNIYNDSHTIIRFNALLRIFSMGYFNVHTVFFCFLSLTGLTALYKTFIPYLSDKKKELLIVVYLLPSVLFWGSGALKESIILFALGMLVYYFSKLFTLKSIVCCVAVALLLAFSKFYVWLSILPGLLFIFWIKRSSTQYVFLKFITIIAIGTLLAVFSEELVGFQSPFVTLSQKQMEFNLLASGNAIDANNQTIAVAGSVLNVAPLQATFYSFLSNAPAALWHLFFRPYLWDSFSPLVLMAAFENILLLFVIGFCILFIKSLKTINWAYVLFCLSFVLIQFVIIGETTPIVGAIVRYKVPALPFLLIAALLLFDKEKAMRKIPPFKKYFSTSQQISTND
jgi:hypothetical protein